MVAITQGAAKDASNGDQKFSSLLVTLPRTNRIVINQNIIKSFYGRSLQMSLPMEYKQNRLSSISQRCLAQAKQHFKFQSAS